MKRMPPVVALLGGASCVVAFVLASSALVFDPPTDASAVVEAREARHVVNPEVTLPPGDGALLVSGDRETMLAFEGFNPEFGAPGDPTYATTSEGDVVNLSWEKNPAGGVYLRHFMLDGLDFFLDPDQCALTPGDIGATGIVPVEVECDGVSDIRDNATISLTGQVEFPFTRFPPPGVTIGGEVVVGGDIEATLAIDEVHWTINQPGSDPPDTAVAELDAFNYTDNSGFSLTLGRPAGGGLSVLYFYYRDNESGSNPPYFELAVGECPATENLVETTGPNTAVYTVTFDCPAIASTEIEGTESEDLTISLQGELTAHRLDLTGR